jgi:hypothetical protein
MESTNHLEYKEKLLILARDHSHEKEHLHPRSQQEVVDFSS